MLQPLTGVDDMAATFTVGRGVTVSPAGLQHFYMGLVGNRATTVLSEVSWGVCAKPRYYPVGY